MKHSLLTTASAFALMALMGIAAPSTAFSAETAPAQTGVYLPDATTDQTRAAIAALPPFDMEKAKQEAYTTLVNDMNAAYQRDLKTWEDDQKLNAGKYAAGGEGGWAKPQPPVINEASLRQAAAAKAMEMKQMRDNEIARISQAAANKESDARIEANNARNLAWHAAANATLEKLTQQAIAKGINQSSYDSIIAKAMEEMYASRLGFQENPGVPMPATFDTPKALELFSQTESQKAWAAANPEMCKGNPYACGIVDKRTTVETTRPSTASTGGEGKSVPTPLPPNPIDNGGVVMGKGDTPGGNISTIKEPGVTNATTNNYARDINTDLSSKLHKIDADKLYRTTNTTP